MSKLQLHGLIALVAAVALDAFAVEPDRLVCAMPEDARVAAMAVPSEGSESVVWVDEPWDGRASTMWLAKAGAASSREILEIPRDAPAGLPAVRHFSLRADLLARSDGVLVAAAAQTAAVPGSIYSQGNGAFRRLAAVKPFAKADVRLLPRAGGARLFWLGSSAIRSLPLDEAGAPAGKETILAENVEVESVAFPDRSFEVTALRDGGFAVFWPESGADRAIDLRARFFNADATRVADLLIAHTANAAARYPTAVVDGERLIVAWQQSASIGLAAIELGTRRIAAKRLIPIEGQLRSVRVGAGLLASIEDASVVVRTITFDGEHDAKPLVLGTKDTNDDFLAVAGNAVYWHGAAGLVSRVVKQGE